MGYWEYKKIIRKCNKDHKCECCNKVIKKGTKYVFFETGSGSWWSRHKFHKECFKKDEFVKKEKAKIYRNNKDLADKTEGANKYPKINKIMKKLPYELCLLSKSEMRTVLYKIEGVINAR